jgi:hypothetical protein
MSERSVIVCDVNDVDERMLERVRKLLARAEHPATPPAEAEACSAKAAALMSRHLIDQAMLESRDDDISIPVTRHVVVVPPYSVAKAVLLDEVAKAFRIRVAIGADGGSDGRRCTLVGFPGDLAMCDLLFTSLLLQASTAMLAASRGRGHVKAFRRAFLFGYAAAIGRRLRQVQRDVEQAAGSDTPGTELVLADRGARVDTAFAQQFPQLRRLRATVSSGGGLVAGQAAGASADLSVTRRRVASRRGELSA